MQTYDAIVIGAGAMGSAAAYYLAKAGQKVLLLEQFDLGHRKGSSQDYSRIIRYSYDEPLYVELAKATYPLWFALEEASGQTLYAKTGGIDFGRPDEQSLKDTIHTVQSANIPHEVLDAQAGKKRFPQFHFDDDMVVLHQPDTGMLFASRCVQTHLAMAQRYGATIYENTPVTGITLLNDSVEVSTAAEFYSAGKLVIAAGGWLRQLVAPLGVELPLHILRCQPTFFNPIHADPADYQIGRMPVFIYHREGDLHQALYGLPDHDGVGVKAAFHGGQRLNSPDEVDYTPDESTVAAIRAVTRTYIPALGDGPMTETRICLYTMSPDEHFIVDHHPEHKHVVLAGGFSGHGFKFSTTIGQILTDLVLENNTLHNISLFRMLRFGLKTK